MRTEAAEGFTSVLRHWLDLAVNSDSVGQFDCKVKKV